MWTLGSCLLLGDRFCGLFPGLLFGMIAISLYASTVFPVAGLSTIVVLLSAVFLAIPLTGKLAGALLDAVSLQVSHDRILESFCVLCACAVFLSGDQLLTFIESFVLFVSQRSVSHGSLFFAELITTVVYCSGIIACVLCLLILAFEIPLAWLSQKQPISASKALRAFRPLVLLLLLSFSFKLSLGLIHAEFHELSQSSLVKGEENGAH